MTVAETRAHALLGNAIDSMEKIYARSFLRIVPSPGFLDSLDEMTSKFWEQLKAEPQLFRQRAIVATHVRKFEEACGKEASRK